MEIVDGGLQTDSSPGPFGDPLEDLGDGRRLRDAREFGRQILLQRLACGFGATLEARMDFGGKVSNQHIQHACIELASSRVRKSTRAMIASRGTPNGGCMTDPSDAHLKVPRPEGRTKWTRMTAGRPECGFCTSFPNVIEVSLATGNRPPMANGSFVRVNARRGGPGVALHRD